jgi:hypothetical protein
MNQSNAAIMPKTTASMPNVEALLGSPDVLFEGIGCMEIGLDSLNVSLNESLDSILKKAAKAFKKDEQSSAEIAIAAMVVALMRTESQGEAIDFGIALAKTLDRSYASR